MSIVEDLRALPLFQGIPEVQLGHLVAAFRPVKHTTGTVLFNPGDVATHFELLVKGHVTLQEVPTGKDTPAIHLDIRPVTPLGELSALTGIPRSTIATAASDIEVWAIGVGDLVGFFDGHADIGLAFYKNLLGLVSDKVRRDRSRLEDMRTNIVRTQKAMKQMREVILDSSETEISKPLHDTLERMIDNNRRANYRVTPSTSYPAHVRLDSGSTLSVLEVSEGHMKIEGKAADLTQDPSFWAGVLVVPSAEILLSGTIVREGGGGVVVKLDKPVDEYKSKLDDYTTRVQLLDFVV